MKRCCKATIILLVLCMVLGGVPAFATDSGNTPPWYPDDVSEFVPFHDASAPRVVDMADIFSVSEEAEIEALIADVSAQTGKDVVIYTDITDYGLGKDICAADFYDFGGYGSGPEYEGICLFIDMDPEDRGGWVCCTGSMTKYLYTESVANSMDDVLYEYLGYGEYAAGVLDWIENVRTLYTKGVPFAPDWYPGPYAQFVRRSNPNAPKVVDEAGVLSDTELAELSEQAQNLSDALGYDVVLLYSGYSYDMQRSDYTERFYIYNGYGRGKDFDGIIAGIFIYSGSVIVRGEGRALAALNEINLERLEKKCGKKAWNEDFYDAGKLFLKDIQKMEKTGRVPESLEYWLVAFAVCLGLGLVFGGISLVFAKRRMRTAVIAVNADAYLDLRSANINRIEGNYIRTDVSRVYDPPSSSSSGGSSSGGSSYSDSYSGSSGRSHSGSGRSF